MGLHINKMQTNQKYFFYFLSPDDFAEFFQSIRQSRYDTFKSRLTSILESQ